MPKTREEKEQIVEDYKEKLDTTKSIVFTTVSGYTMDDADELREKGREADVDVHITKKTLLLRALEDTGIEATKEDLPGSILTAFGYSDAVSSAKIMKEFAEDREHISITAGILEGELVGVEKINTLAELPSKEELHAKVVGSLNAPVSGFVNALSGNLRKLVYALNAVKDAKEA